MLYKEIFRILGKYLKYFTIVLTIPLGVALYYDFIVSHQDYPQPSSWVSFITTIIICIILSALFSFFGEKAEGNISRRESIVLVVLIWFFSAFISALPFYFSKTLENPIDCYFEAMSGLTTTGASTMCAKAYDPSGKEIPLYNTNIHFPEKTYTYYGTIKPIKDPHTKLVVKTGIEAVSRGILFWRSFIQWLGGMGIVVLFIAILPALAVGGKFLYEMEVPGPTKETLTPRIKETASILWKLYLAATIIEIYLLIWTNEKMPLFDAFCITFSTLSTGGFGVRNESIGSYANIHTEWIVILFMILGSVNFSLYFHLVRRRLYRIYEPDFLFFLLIIVLGSLFVSLPLIGQKQILLNGAQSTYTLSSAIREGSFQAVSAQTSTGFSTANYDRWPLFSQLIMLILMFIGGMSGSTAGGIKTSRIFILYKIIAYKITSIVRPETIKKLKIGESEISPNIAMTVLVYFCIVIFFTVLGTVGMVYDGIDPDTSLGSIACMMNNIGMAFRAAGPTESFAFLPSLSKIISIFWMLLGRLEFFSLLLLFIPSFWKQQI
ncbi:MAG: TrkH family potassium uptake protein [Parachlamydiales bacterium]|nr:TrkH family potassium uptake protein [Parachlamydiales bacterium]